MGRKRPRQALLSVSAFAPPRKNMEFSGKAPNHSLMKPTHRLVAISSIPALLLACASPKTATRETASAASYSQPPTELGEVWGDEQLAQASEVLDDNEKMLLARTK